VPQIDVSFEIDANGLVSVSALDKMTGQEQAMQITPSSGLMPEEIERLIMEAEQSVEQDREERALILQRNKLDNAIKGARRAMAELGRNLELSEQQEINEVLSGAEEYVTSRDTYEIENAQRRVEDASARITMSVLTPV
jgi:molecular chaperone DnaK